MKTYQLSVSATLSEPLVGPASDGAAYTAYGDWLTKIETDGDPNLPQGAQIVATLQCVDSSTTPPTITNLSIAEAFTAPAYTAPS